MTLRPQLASSVCQRQSKNATLPAQVSVYRFFTLIIKQSHLQSYLRLSPRTALMLPFISPAVLHLFLLPPTDRGDCSRARQSRPWSRMWVKESRWVMGRTKETDPSSLGKVKLPMSEIPLFSAQLLCVQNPPLWQVGVKIIERIFSYKCK